MATVLIIDDSRAERTEIRKMLAGAGLFAGLRLGRLDTEEGLFFPGFLLLRSRDSEVGEGESIR